MRILTRKQFQDDMAKMWSEAVHAEYKAQIEAAFKDGYEKGVAGFMQAVELEREAWAKVAEQFEPDEKTSYVTYASTAIRARGQA